MYGKLQLTPYAWLIPIQEALPRLHTRLEQVRTMPQQMKKASEEAIRTDWLGLVDELRNF
jgi:hypothetical protein